MTRFLLILILTFSLAAAQAQQPEALTLESVLSIAPPADLTGVQAFWSRDSAAILAKYTTRDGAQFIAYDIATGEASEPLTLPERLAFPLAWLPQGGEGALWSREGDRVALVEGGTLSVYLTPESIPDQPDFVALNVDQAAWSADGHYVAYSDNSGVHVWDAQAGAMTVYLRGLNLHRFTWFSGYPTFAVPESLGIENRTILPYDAATGEAYEPLIAPEAWAGGLRRLWWSPNGEYLFSELAYEGIDTYPAPVVWNMETGEIVDLGMPDAYGWDWHPNSRWLAYLDRSSVLIGIIDIDEGHVIERILSEIPVTSFSWSSDGTALLFTDETGSIHIYRVIETS